MTEQAEAQEQTEADLMAEADNLLWGRDADAEGAPEAEEMTDGATLDGEEPEEDDAEPEEATEEAEEQDDDAEDEGEEDEPEEAKEDEEPKKPNAREYAEIRRKQRQVARREKEIADQQRQFQEQQQQFEARARQYEVLEQQMRTDPEAAFGALAQRAGMTSDQAFERVMRRRIGEDDGLGAVASEVQQLKQEIARRDAEAAKQRQEWERRQHAQQFQTGVQSDVQTIVGELAKPERQQQFPYLAAMSPTHREAQLREAVVYAVNNKLQMSLQEIAAAIDADVFERYSHMQKVLGGTSSDDGKPAGQGSPARRAKPGASKRRTVSNTDAASGSTTRRELTPEERLLAADEELSGWSAEQY